MFTITRLERLTVGAWRAELDTHDGHGTRVVYAYPEGQSPEGQCWQLLELGSGTSRHVAPTLADALRQYVQGL